MNIARSQRQSMRTEMFVIPKPLSTDELEALLIKYGVGQ